MPRPVLELLEIHITGWLQNKLPKRCGIIRRIRNSKHENYANRARRIANNVIIPVSCW